MKKKAKKRYVVERDCFGDWVVIGDIDTVAHLAPPCTRSDAQELADKLNGRGK